MSCTPRSSRRTGPRSTTPRRPTWVTQDMLIGQARQLEEFQWFVRAHLESADGTLSTTGTAKERTAAGRATKKAKAR
jgi:hypothetical protein